MNKFLNFVVCFLSAWLVENSAMAAVDALDLAVKAPHGSNDLVIEFKDHVAVPNACDLFVQRFEFVASKSILLLNVSATEPCFIDRYGQRSGSFRWVLPQALQQKGKFCVIVNQKEIGTFAYDRANSELSLQSSACE